MHSGGGVGIAEILRVSLKGKHAVVIGRSEIVGKPVALLLLKEDMTVTICHSKTIDLPFVVHDADVVIAALGKPGVCQRRMDQEWRHCD